MNKKEWFKSEKANFMKEKKKSKDESNEWGKKVGKTALLAGGIIGLAAGADALAS